MIGRLTGTVVNKQPPALLLDVNGVGYAIEAPMSTFYRLADIGDKAQLLIHTHVREDAILLYGFATEAERSLFRALLKITGVGAKLALTILSGIDVAGFAACVHAEDSTTLTRLPGVGKKTAQRLVIEMKDKLPQQIAAASTDFAQAPTAAAPTQTRGIDEAIQALHALGYTAVEANRMVKAVANSETLTNTEEIIRHALQTAMLKNAPNSGRGSVKSTAGA